MVKKTVIKVLLSIILILLFFTFIMPISKTTYFGWVEITDKNIVDDKYYLSGNLEEPIEIAVNATDTFIYEGIPDERSEVTISQIWDTINPNKEYFVRIKTNSLISTYKLEELYGY